MGGFPCVAQLDANPLVFCPPGFLFCQFSPPLERNEQTREANAHAMRLKSEERYRCACAERH